MRREFVDHTICKFVRAPLASLGKVDNLQRDKFGYLIPFAPDELEPGTYDIEGYHHSLNVFSVESEITRKRDDQQGALPEAVCTETPRV
jgi:hypothetical protein